jgi:hypothetical protein
LQEQNNFRYIAAINIKIINAVFGCIELRLGIELAMEYQNQDGKEMTSNSIFVVWVCMIFSIRIKA